MPIKEKNAVATMSKIKDMCSKEKIRMHMAKNFLEGAAKVLLKNLSSDSAPAEIVNLIEEAGAKVKDSRLMKNKETKRLAGLAKAMLVSSITLSK